MPQDLADLLLLGDHAEDPHRSRTPRTDQPKVEGARGAARKVRVDFVHLGDQFRPQRARFLGQKPNRLPLYRRVAPLLRCNSRLHLRGRVRAVESQPARGLAQRRIRQRGEVCPCAFPRSVQAQWLLLFLQGRLLPEALFAQRAAGQEHAGPGTRRVQRVSLDQDPRNLLQGARGLRAVYSTPALCLRLGAGFSGGASEAAVLERFRVPVVWTRNCERRPLPSRVELMFLLKLVNPLGGNRPYLPY